MEFNLRRCQHCGTFPEDWIDSERHRADPPPYTVDSVRCYGCVSLAEEQEMMPKESKGFYFYLKPYREGDKDGSFG